MDFSTGTIILILWPWPWSLTYFWKPCLKLRTVSDKALIFHMSVPSYKTCHWVTFFLTQCLWPWSFIYFLKKKNNLASNFRAMGARTLIFFVTRPFWGFQYFSPGDIGLGIWPFVLKTLTLLKSFQVYATVFTLHMNINLDKILL